MNRPNLDVVTLAHVTRIRFDGTRATGVDYTRGRRGHTAHAGEVVLCGGAINSPHLLQLSGVGAADDLRALGIGVVADLPGVGENLQDHLEVYVQHACTQPVSMAPYFAMRNRPRVGAEWILRKTGPGATNHFEAGGFVRSNEDVAYPNLMFHFLPIAVRYDGTLPPGGGGHGYQVHIGPMYSDARGTIKLVSADPATKPALRFNYLSTEQDRREWVEAIRVTRAILEAPAFAPFSGGELSPGPEVATDQQVLDWVARDAETALHPSCTAKLGTGELAVVDPATMRVHGLDGLRVVDASVFPYVTNGNIYAPVMMTAEKAADLIRGDTPLPPEPVEFYRHRSGVAGHRLSACHNPPPHMAIEAVIFDCDGTLVDSEPLARTAWEQTLAPHGYAISDAEYPALVGLPYARVHGFFAERIPGLPAAGRGLGALRRHAVRPDRHRAAAVRRCAGDWWRSCARAGSPSRSRPPRRARGWTGRSGAPG